MGRKSIWVHMTVTEMVKMFERLGGIKNIGETKAMVCTLGFIWGQQGTSAYKNRATGEGGTFWEQKKTREIFEECGGER